jgi:hypothetical protein
MLCEKLAGGCSRDYDRNYVKNLNEAGLFSETSGMKPLGEEK